MAVDRFEFVVQGVPRSLQAKPPGRRAWMNKVAAAAQETWPANRPPMDEELSVAIIYYHAGDADVDVDNIIKPILDALVNVAYVDDKLVSQVTSRRTRLEAGLVIENVTPVLAEGLEMGEDFVYVALRSAPDHGRIP